MDRKCNKDKHKGIKEAVRYLVMIALSVLLVCDSSLVEAKEDPISNAKNGIIEIYSGFLDESGQFHKLQNASGFVIATNESSAYIITTDNTLKNSNDSKKEYCEKNEISYSDGNLQDAIKVVIKGDVIADAAILTESDKQNFAILQIDSSMSEKQFLSFGNSGELVTGTVVYTLGFAEDAGQYDEEINRHTEFSALDVEVYEGTVQDTQANQTGIMYIQHSAKVTGGNTGGPLIDEEGYVVGINNVTLNQDGESIYYSLPVDEIKTVLDNFQIQYKSKDKNEILNRFNEEINECEILIADKKYKEKSKESLQQAIEEAKTLISEGNENEEELADAIVKMEEAKSLLELRMKTSRKVIYVLAGVILLLGIWMVKLLAGKIKYQKNKTTETERKVPIQPEEMKREAKVQEVAKEKKEVSSPLEMMEEPEEKTFILNTGRNDGRQRLPMAYLRCLRTGQVVLIKKSEFYIGKNESINDFVVEGNPAISKSHALVQYEEGKYFIRDCDSSNGTFVNGTEVLRGQRIMLQNGDEIVLADEKFVINI